MDDVSNKRERITFNNKAIRVADDTLEEEDWELKATEPKKSLTKQLSEAFSSHGSRNDNVRRARS